MNLSKRIIYLVVLGIVWTIPLFSAFNPYLYSNKSESETILFSEFSSFPNAISSNSQLIIYKNLLPRIQDVYMSVGEPSSKDTTKPKERSTNWTLLPRPRIWRDQYFEHKFGSLNNPVPDEYNGNLRLDSSSSSVYSNEKYGDIELAVPYQLNLDDYLNYRKKVIREKIWDSLITRYDVARSLSKRDIAGLLGSVSGMTIPIPPNPLTGIFGKPEISINVNGEVNVRLGLRYDTQNLGTTSQFGQSQWSPMFDQEIRVNVSASIGDKFKFGTDWNTKKVFDYDNKFKIGFEGEDDDIIKLVEVGDVSLPLKSQLIGGGEALFGIRTDFQFGPLFLKTLFSQRRGQRKWVDVKGGASKQYFSLRAYDWAKNHFFLDTVYKKIYDEYFKYSTPIIPPSSSYYRIKRYEVYESASDIRDYATRSANGIAIDTLTPVGDGQKYSSSFKKSPIIEGRVEKASFMLLDSTRYRIDRNLGTLHFKSLREDRFYAVAYSIEGPTDSPNDDIYYGTFSNVTEQKDTMVLKLIYRPNLQPAFKTLWSRQMKNIYQINASNVTTADTKISLWYIRQSNDSTDVLEGVPDKLVTIFGVDQVTNGSGAAPPDGQFDLRPPYFDALYGEITFPSSEPFGDGLRKYFAKDKIGNPDLAELYTFDDVYDTTYAAAARNTARDRFRISGEVSGRSSNKIVLNDFNLAPNSVRVTLDGVQLKEYQDYVVDYFSGTITMKNSRAMQPNANLKVEYEKHDIFNISTRTLAGIRADYNLLKTRRANATLGATFMYYDQSVIIDRVMLGEEPVSNSMFGVDAEFRWDTPWLTKLLDYLPFYDTKVPSSMNFKAEWALMMPTPNKRTSDVLSDMNSPVVYIDNFEGAQRYITLGLNPTQWTFSSQPNDIRYWDSDITAAKFRANIMWFQYIIPRVPIRNVYPNNKSYQQGNQNISPLYINFDPYIRGIYNKNPEFLDTLNPEYSEPAFANKGNNKQKIWGGMQRLLSSFNTNFDNENIEFIEIMMSVEDWEKGQTKMYIDLGQISEDIIPNNHGDTEDGSTKANPVPNGIIDAGEDTGLDTLDNTEEKAHYLYPLNLENDPARDDYRFDFNKEDKSRTWTDFTNYNNYEGKSKVSEMGQFPDQEMLNSNNGMNISESNSYFTYEVDINPDPMNNPQIVGGSGYAGTYQWHLYRIPVRKPTSKFGTPSYSNIQYVRIRYQGGKLKAAIADWRLLGSQWQRTSNLQNVNPNDSVLAISFVNLWENSEAPDYYAMPPGVSAPRQMNNPDPTVDIQMNEQSINVGVRNLRYGEERMATRIYRAQDIFNYKKMKLFFHGDGSMPDKVTSGSIPKAYCFIRFGVDSSNYYEYRRPLTRGWQDVEIDLTELTSFKQIRDTGNVYGRQTFPVAGDAQAYFAIKGNPILTRVSFFGLGIANPAENYPNELTTSLWIDELRLIDPESSSDWAAIANADIKLADLGTVNASVQKFQPNFHQLEERFGNRVDAVNWTFTTQGNLEKLAPKVFSGLRLPIAYTHAEFMQTPQYQASNDVNLEQAANATEKRTYANLIKSGVDEATATIEAKKEKDKTVKASQTMRVQDSWSLTGVKLGIPIKHWLVEETLNKLTMGYNYSQEFLRSPIYEQQFNWVWQLNAGYSTNIPDIVSLKPLAWIKKEFPLFGTYRNWKINFLPSAISASVNMNRRRQTEQSRFLDFASPVLRNFSARKEAGFSWKLSEEGLLSPIIDYQFSTNSTLAPIETDDFGNNLPGSEVFRRMFANGIYLGVDNLHNQTFTVNFKPMIPGIKASNRYITMSGSYSSQFSWTDPMQPDIKIADASKSVSVNSNMRFTIALQPGAIADDWFGKLNMSSSPIPTSQGGLVAGPSEEAKIREKQLSTGTLGRIFQKSGQILRLIFLEWDKSDFIFNQQTSSINSGVYGSTGLGNFWGGMALQPSSLSNGSSFAYQMGLVSNPHGGFNMVSTNRFPWVGFSTYAGLRPADAILTDNFRQTTSLELKGNRKLWKGATMEINFKTEEGYNKNQTVTTDQYGVPRFSAILANSSIKRTYLSCPTIFGWNPANNTIDHIVELFNVSKVKIVASNMDTIRKNTALQAALSDAFFEGLRAISITKGTAARFVPAPNWKIRWEGLEGFALWKDIVKRMSLEHSYTSNYNEEVQITDNGRVVQKQAVRFGFEPLFGISASLDEEKLKGAATGQLRWSTTTTYSFNGVTKTTIQGNSTDEITLQGAYTMKGFEFPLFGMVIKNDVELSMIFTYKRNYRSTYDVLDKSSYTGNNKNGRTLEGNTQIILEPRARYNVSKVVTASAFLRYEGTINQGDANAGYSTFQLGVDLRISLSGGR